MNTSFDDDKDKFFEEFNDAKDEDEKKLMNILQNLIEEMNAAKDVQQSLKTDNKRDKFVELSPDTQMFTDMQYLAIHSN